ncbi:hypothetical protein [Fusobacterium sp.]|jgi:hypothetical protein|uniref:hypothetical protein n=1 Tax=Fusobacterium sp. TaxID=68766 RepID=UPI00261D9013|nr:hypothetical protein [Fusobacterium sp.]
MKGKKEIQLANFNCTFGTVEENASPMLKYFTEIIYPAFKRKKKYRKTFFFEDIKLGENKKIGYYLYGKIIKDTTLEITSRYDWENNTLVDTDEKYRSSPFSEFILMLNNHRLLFIPGSKGHPRLSSLKTLLKYNIERVIKEHNKKSLPEEELPEIYSFDIIEIPKKTDVFKQIEMFEEIKSFSLEFIKLNPEPLSGILQNIDSIRERCGSNSSKYTMKNPTEKKVIAEIIQESNGLASFSMEARKKDESEVREYKNDNFKVTRELIFPEHETLENNINLAINDSFNDPRINDAKRAEKKLYEIVVEKIKTFIF